jgi:hypothetical protein
MRTLRLVALVLGCCFVVGLSYLLVLRAGLRLWSSSLNPCYQPGIGLDPKSALFLAVLLILVPYLVGGIFLGLLRTARYALPIGLVTTIAERLLIFGAAAFVLGQFRQVTETGEVIYVEGGPDIIGAIRSEALPHFGWGYIILGVPISIQVLYLAARAIENGRGREIAEDHALSRNR